MTAPRGRKPEGLFTAWRRQQKFAADRGLAIEAVHDADAAFRKLSYIRGRLLAYDKQQNCWDGQDARLLDLLNYAIRSAAIAADIGRELRGEGR